MKSVPNNKNRVAAIAGCNQEVSVQISIKTAYRISLWGKMKLTPTSVCCIVGNINIHTWPVNIFMTFDFLFLSYSSIMPTCALTKNTCDISCCDSFFEIFISPTKLSQPNDHWISYLNPKYENYCQFWECTPFANGGWSDLSISFRHGYIAFTSTLLTLFISWNRNFLNFDA